MTEQVIEHVEDVVVELTETEIEAVAGGSGTLSPF